MPRFGDYIRGTRERKGWTLREASIQTGIPHSRLFELEKGVSSKTGKPVLATRQNLEKLAKGYQLPMDQLFALAHFPDYLKVSEGLAVEELAMLDLFRALSPAKQRLWLSIGEGLKNLE
ncbi:MAG: helix-turn-helix domain-containing protein [Bacteroidota bacterium]